MGHLRYLYDFDTDTVLYSFVQVGHTSAINLSMGRDFNRRESVQAVPGMDSVLDAYGRTPGPMDRRDMTFAFRRLTGGDNDAEYDLLAAALAPGTPVRLVYETDSGALWYTNAYNARIGNTETAAGNWGRDGYVDFTVTWRIRPDWRPRLSEASEVFHSNTLFVSGTSFGNAGATNINAPSQAFNIDARGTAGLDLPTIPDLAPTITITGPTGGTQGLRIQNGSLLLRDAAGALQSTYFDIPFPIPAGNGMVLRMDRQAFALNGQPFRPRKPPYQPWYFGVKNGVQNSCTVLGLGTGIQYGAAIIGVTMTNQGSGYFGVPPTVIFSGDGAGAAGTAILDGLGHVTGVNMTAFGYGYVTTPSVSFSGGSGSGAAGTPILSRAAITVDWWRKRA